MKTVWHRQPENYMAQTVTTGKIFTRGHYHTRSFAAVHEMRTHLSSLPRQARGCCRGAAFHLGAPEHTTRWCWGRPGTVAPLSSRVPRGGRHPSCSSYATGEKVGRELTKSSLFAQLSGSSRSRGQTVGRPLKSRDLFFSAGSQLSRAASCSVHAG